MDYQFRPIGTGVALVTPFYQGQIDFDALSRVVEHVINGGVEYLVALGTTGESGLLTGDEQHQVLRAIVKQTNGRKPIVAGNFGGMSTARIMEKLQTFDLEGVQAILSSSPAYIKPTQEGIYQHYLALSTVSPLPIMMYNVPGRTASNMSAETIVRIANASEKFIAVKDASADLLQGASISRDCPEHFHLLSGDDPTALGLIANGASGVISVIANAFPSVFSTMVGDALVGNKNEALRAELDLLNFHPLLYKEGNPTGIKALLEILELCHREVRLPLVSCTDETFQDLKVMYQQRALSR